MTRLNALLTYTTTAILGAIGGILLAAVTGETFTFGGGLGIIIGLFFGLILYETRRDGLENLESRSARNAKVASGIAILAVFFSIYSIFTMVSGGNNMSGPTSTSVASGTAVTDIIIGLTFAAILLAIVAFGAYGAWTGRVRLTWIVAAPMTVLSIIGLPFGGAWLLPTTIPLLIAALALSVVNRTRQSATPDSV